MSKGKTLIFMCEICSELCRCLGIYGHSQRRSAASVQLIDLDLLSVFSSPLSPDLHAVLLLWEAPPTWARSWSRFLPVKRRETNSRFLDRHNISHVELNCLIKCHFRVWCWCTDMEETSAADLHVLFFIVFHVMQVMSFLQWCNHACVTQRWS